jgi:hypothetical protein
MAPGKMSVWEDARSLRSRRLRRRRSEALTGGSSTSGTGGVTGWTSLSRLIRRGVAHVGQLGKRCVTTIEIRICDYPLEVAEGCLVCLQMWKMTDVGE